MRSLPAPSVPPLISGPDTGRIAGYDLARGMAILAMVVINSKVVFSPLETLPLWLCKGVELLDRRAAVVLVMLAGAGTTLLAQKSGLPAKRMLKNRAAFLFLAGILLSLVWTADILHFYGVFLLVGTWCLGLTGRALLAVAGLFWLGGSLCQLEPVVLFLEDLEPGSAALYIADLLFNGYYPVFPWAAFFLVGMWVGRRDVRHPWFVPGMLTGGCLMVAALPLISVYYPVENDLSVPTPWSVLSGMGTGCCVIALGIYWAAVPDRPWAAYLLSAGKTTLTLYVGHILFMRALDQIPGLPDHYDIPAVLCGALLFFSAYTGLMRYWLTRHARGPLEALMRQFPYIRLSGFLKQDIWRPM